ncbi:hypothetical protein [Paracoccus zhejiangensis]|uniref:SH3 domain-containing protein n=1 Tax=Paracoccus zhejiangensis TaxID=1077935 RepID=A0A2H5F362_9RHOB|nr:hypothetical protein [Paracoccus zhejiangensis]AUH65984.1 hypothetical protein CX676_18985 [Paracoccus zhejiangensis]
MIASMLSVLISSQLAQAAPKTETQSPMPMIVSKPAVTRPADQQVFIDARPASQSNGDGGSYADGIMHDPAGLAVGDIVQVLEAPTCGMLGKTRDDGCDDNPLLA